MCHYRGAFVERMCQPVRAMTSRARAIACITTPLAVSFVLAIGALGAFGTSARATPRPLARPYQPPASLSVPLDASSPWPEMRHDPRNSGFASIDGTYRGDRPWTFSTGRGIFSTPVSGGDGTVYVGSADDMLYHVTTPSSGRPRILWTFRASVPPVAGQEVD